MKKEYVSKSIKKLKDEILSKAFYDFIKYLAIIIATGGIVLFFPKNFNIVDLLMIEISISVLNLILLVLFFIISSIYLYFKLNKKNYERIHKELLTDELTGVLSYKALKKDILKIHTWASIEDKTYSLIIMDIDDFYKIHHIGDNAAEKILAKVGRFLNSEISEIYKVYRNRPKGDEFLFIIKGNLENAVKLANSKRKAIASTNWQLNGYPEIIKITISCGVVELDIDDDIDYLFERLDGALKKAKSIEGKNSTISMV